MTEYELACQYGELNDRRRILRNSLRRTRRQIVKSIRAREALDAREWLYRYEEELVPEIAELSARLRQIKSEVAS